MSTVRFVYLILLASNCFSIDEIDFESNPENCTCVPYFQCSEETGKIITDGSGLFDVRDFNKPNTCTGYFDVCCTATPHTLYDSSSADDSGTFPFGSLPNSVDGSLTPIGRGCGYQYPGSFPWAGALLYRETALQGAQYKCGVALIHRQAVLTAAHCLKEGIEEGEEGVWSVRVGHMSRDTKHILLHPEYSARSLHNDIALIILSAPVQLSSKVNPICIPSIGVSLDETLCTASVWAKDVLHQNPTTYLKMVKLPIVPRDKCLKSLRRTRLGQFFRLDKSFICAGGEEFADTCGGDGGSPLVCPVANQPGRYHQAGIVSWGIGCGENNVPGVYANLPVFRDWIDKVMLKHGLEITDYRY